MSNVWERFDSIVSTDEVKLASEKFAPLEAGTYVVYLEKIEPSETKMGLPMLKGVFKTLESGRNLYYNQVLQNINNPNMTAYNVAEAVKFVSDLVGEDVEFEGLGQFANIVSTIPTRGVYKLEVKYGNKDLEHKFPKFKIVEKLADDVDSYDSCESTDCIIKDENIPF